MECENNGKDGHAFLGIEGSGRKIRIIDAPGLGNIACGDFKDDEVIVKEVKDWNTQGDVCEEESGQVPDLSRISILNTGQHKISARRLPETI